MGQELECRVRYQGRSLLGQAYLETDYLLFRGDERLKIPLKDLRNVRAKAGVLRLEFDGGPAEFELGKAAEKWAEKVLHPPSRLEKLGVKPGIGVKLVGEFDEDFRRELEGATCSRANASLVLFAAKAMKDLAKLSKLAGALASDGALWVIYPKGIAAIRETDVIRAGREMGLKDVKVARFSETHTGLKFVVPVDKR